MAIKTFKVWQTCPCLGYFTLVLRKGCIITRNPRKNHVHAKYSGPRYKQHFSSWLKSWPKTFRICPTFCTENAPPGIQKENECTGYTPLHYMRKCLPTLHPVVKVWPQIQKKDESHLTCLNFGGKTQLFLLKERIYILHPSLIDNLIFSSGHCL